MKKKRKSNDPKPMEFSISHTRRRSNDPISFYRVQLGKHWEDELRLQLNATVSQLEARLVFYGTNNFFDLVVRKSPFLDRADKATQTGGKTYAWAGEGRQPGNGKPRWFLAFTMLDDKVIDYNTTYHLITQGKTLDDFRYQPTFQKFAVTRVTPTVAPFNPKDPAAHLWDDGHTGKMVCLTFSMGQSLKAPSIRDRRTKVEMKEAARLARREIAHLENRPTTGAKQLALPLSTTTPAPIETKQPTKPQTLQDRLRDRFMDFKAVVLEAAQADMIVTLEGSGEDVAMTTERIQRVTAVYR